MFRIPITAAVFLLAVAPSLQAEQAAASAPQSQQAAASPALSSPFDNYRPFTEATVAPWKDTNREVLQAGGWRAYAREASGAASAPAPAPAAMPAASPTAPHKH